MLDDTQQSQLLDWLNSGTTGASAKSIASHLAGHGEQDGSYPLDAGDFGRCERLLDMVPGLREDLPRMAEVNAYWAALVSRWDDIRDSGDRTALIRKIVGEIQSADPGHVNVGPGVHMRFGANTFGAEQGREPRMKETDADRKVRDDAYGVAAGELRSFIERWERLESEKKDIADQQKEVMAEAKARGYDTKVMRKVIALRKREPDDVAEEEAVLEMYKAALGMS